MMDVKIKRLSEHAVIPKYAKPGDSGFDLVAINDVIIDKGSWVKIPIGLAFEIPEGYELQIRPRSGITSKTPLRVQFGTIDSGYRGEVMVSVDNLSRDDWSNQARRLDNTYIEESRDKVFGGTYVIKRGDKIAQGVISPVLQATFDEVEALSDTERGEFGFGSTGVK